MLTILKAGATSQSITISILDSASTTGGRKTGLAFNTANLIAYYLRPGGSPVAITLVTLASINSSYSSGGFKEADATNMKGQYRLDVPDAMIAAGVPFVTVSLSGATGMAQVDALIMLSAVDMQDAVHFGLSAIPNVAAGANGGLPLGNGSGQVALQDGGITTAKFADGALTAAKFATDFFQTIWDKATSALTTVGSIGKLLVDNINATITSRSTYAGGDTSGTTTLLARLTSARATLLDWLDIGGLVAASSEVTAIQNNTRAARVILGDIERPDSGSIAYRVELLLYDEVGNMEAPDSVPVIGVVNQAGTSRAANLDSTTMSLVSTGRYRSTYTVDSAHTLEQLVFSFTVVEGGATRVYSNTSLVVDTTAVDFTGSDRTNLNTILANLGTPATASLSGDVAAVKTVSDAIKLQSDKMNFTGTDIKATLDGETVTPTDGSITAAKIAANAIGASQLATDAVTEIINALLAANVEDTITVKQSLMIVNALLAGLVDGAGTGTMHFRNIADTLNRITASGDAAGNRTAITRNFN